MPYVTTQAGSLYHEDQGTGDPLVFLPGLGGDARAFAVLGRGFATSHRVIVFDPRDAGRSFRAEADYTTRDMATDFAEALDQLGVRGCTLVGHSLGGLVSQELVLARPDLVSRLVLASTHAGSNLWRRAVISSWVTMRHQTDAGTFTRISLPWLVAPDFYHNETQVEGLVRFSAKNEWGQTPDAFERQAKAAMQHDARGRLNAIKVPTLVVGGGLDLVNPPIIAQHLVDEIPGSVLKIIPEAGHMPHIETGLAFKTVLTAFLSDQP